VDAGETVDGRGGDMTDVDVKANAPDHVRVVFAYLWDVGGQMKKKEMDDTRLPRMDISKSPVPSI